MKGASHTEVIAAMEGQEARHNADPFRTGKPVTEEPKQEPLTTEEPDGE